MRRRWLLALGLGALTMGACTLLAGIDDNYASQGAGDASTADASPIDAGASYASDADASPGDATVLGTAVSVAVGSAHACALTQDGRVLCWGQNNYGQLGTGTGGGMSTIPTPVNLSVAALAIAAGVEHTCALVLDGGVMCWGDDSHDEIVGSGATIVTPRAVTLPGPASAIAIGALDSCAIVSGDVYCWGDNAYGECGRDAGGGNVLTPVKIAGMPDGGVVSVSINGNSGSVPTAHACALASSGVAYCWGDRTYDAIGDSRESDAGVSLTVASAVAIEAGVTGISAGQFHSCALTEAGTGFCWGKNAHGEIGNGATSNPNEIPTPTMVMNLQGATSIIAGDYLSCATVGAGGAGATVTCWGANSVGQLGADAASSVNAALPQKVYLDEGVTQISTSLSTVCAVTAKGGVRCWGKDEGGEIGDGVVIPLQDGGAFLPVAVFGFPQ